MSLSFGFGPGTGKIGVPVVLPPYVFPGTNLLLQPTVFDNAVWAKSGTTVTANAGVAPDGTTTADKIIKAASSGQGIIQQDVVLANGGTPTAYLVGLLAKANAYTKVAFREANITGAYAAFQLTSTGSLLDQGAGSSSATITALADSWYKILIPVSFSGDTTYRFSFLSLDSAYTTGSVTGNWTGNGTDGLLFAMAHLSLA